MGKPPKNLIIIIYYTLMPGPRPRPIQLGYLLNQLIYFCYFVMYFQMADSEPDDSVGPRCTKIGLAKQTLLQDLETMDPAKFTNGHLHEIGKHVQETKIQWKAVQVALGKAYTSRTGHDWSSLATWAVLDKFGGV